MHPAGAVHGNGVHARLPSAPLHLLARRSAIAEVSQSPTPGAAIELKSAQFGQCLIDQLLPQTRDNQSTLTLDLLVAAHSAPSANSPAIVLAVSGDDNLNSDLPDKYTVNRLLPFEHATDCPCRRAVSLNLQSPPSAATKPIKVASVVIPYHAPSGRHLITRRTETLSVFPRAWVFPGGVVDEHESPINAGIRELHEECNLVVTEADLQPLCIWESAYPTEDMKAEYPRAHHCIVYYVASINDGNEKPPATDCNAAEVDCALWLSAEQLQMLSKQGSESTEQWPTTDCDKHITASEVCGSYPNRHGSGVGKGHLFAIRTLLEYGRQQQSTNR